MRGSPQDHGLRGHISVSTIQYRLYSIVGTIHKYEKSMKKHQKSVKTHDKYMNKYEKYENGMTKRVGKGMTKYEKV